MKPDEDENTIEAKFERHVRKGRLIHKLYQKGVMQMLFSNDANRFGNPWDEFDGMRRSRWRLSSRRSSLPDSAEGGSGKTKKD